MLIRHNLVGGRSFFHYIRIFGVSRCLGTLCVLLTCVIPTLLTGTGNSSHQASACDVDIVITVRNSLGAVKQLLFSLERNTWRPDGSIALNCATVFLVNSGSDSVTSAYLERISAQNHVHLTYVLISCACSSYTRAANLGISAGSASTVILLNSDVVLPRFWTHYLKIALSADPSVVMAGPLSNSACYQSIPRVNPRHWSKNKLPEHLDIEKVNKFVREGRTPEFPRVPLINGFAMALKRSIIGVVGYLNETAFPVGYGEENEFCMRVRAAGFFIVIADNLYLYHERSASFGELRRRQLIESANEAYSADLKTYIAAAYRELLNKRVLVRLRHETSILFSS
jgi:hypothetical protein